MWLGLNAILEHAHTSPPPAPFEPSAPDTSSLEPSPLKPRPFERLGPTFLAAASQRVGQTDSPFGIVPAFVTGKAPWGRSFEQITDAMVADGRIYYEGDGSFVLCGSEPCAETNRQTLWFGCLPQKIRIGDTPHWRAATAEAPNPAVVWRIEGNLCDGARGLDSVTLNGCAPWSEWLRLLELLRPIPVSDSPALPCPVLQLHHFGQHVGIEI